MTPDNERRTWREAVRAFRLAVSALKDPAPALFADLSAQESLRDLTQEPPLVSFSPFDALPDGVLADPYEQPSLPGSDPGRVTDHPTGRRTAGTDSPRASGPLRSPRNLPGATPSQDDEPAARPPVFSFRQSGRAAQRQPSQRNQDIRGDSAKEAESKAHTGRFRLPGPTPEDRQREAPVVGDTRLEADDHPPGEHGSAHPMALLNDLADSFLEATGGRGSDLPVPGSGDLPEPDREAHGNSAMALIGSLAEYLLSPQVRAVGDLPRSGENTPGTATTASGGTDRPEETTASARPPLAFLDSVHEEPTGGLTSGSKPSDLDKEVSGIAFDRYMDAETFASLVNDVLVEQARRHGVDLS